MKFLSYYLNSIWDSAEREYRQAILSCIERNLDGRLLDLGCDTGEWTEKLADKMGIRIRQAYGIELIRKRYASAVKKGIRVKESDLNNRFPFRSRHFEVVHANQVIEHIWNLDGFIEEIFRVLTPNGKAIICTENLSSWHNIGALVLGFQPFSLTNISTQGHIGNPLHLDAVKRPGFSTWQHSRVLSYEGLKDIFMKHGFKVICMKGYGYFPFPHSIASIFSKIDSHHAPFLMIVVQKRKRK